MSPFGDPTFSDPTFFWPEWPHCFWPDFEKSSQPCVFVLVMGSNIYICASYNHYSSLNFFLSIPDRSIKQTHFPVIIFHCVAEKKQPTTTLSLAWHSRNDKGLWPVIISLVHGKTLTLRHAALCLHLTGVWSILNAAVNCSSGGYSYTRELIWWSCL